MWICDEQCSVESKFRTESRPFVPGEPESIRRNLRIWSTQHLEGYVCNYVFQRDRQVGNKITRAQAASFLTAETDEIDGSFRTLAGCQGPSKLHDRDAAGSIIVGTIEDPVTCGRLINTEMVQVGAQHNHLMGQFWIRTTQQANNIPGGSRGFRFRGTSKLNPLHKAFAARLIKIASRLE